MAVENGRDSGRGLPGVCGESGHDQVCKGKRGMALSPGIERGGGQERGKMSLGGMAGLGWE